MTRTGICVTYRILHPRSLHKASRLLQAWLIPLQERRRLVQARGTKPPYEGLRITDLLDSLYIILEHQISGLIQDSFRWCPVIKLNRDVSKYNYTDTSVILSLQVTHANRGPTGNPCVLALDIVYLPSITTSVLTIGMLNTGVERISGCRSEESCLMGHSLP